jgi:hypothetical protein
VAVPDVSDRFNWVAAGINVKPLSVAVEAQFRFLDRPKTAVKSEG